MIRRLVLLLSAVALVATICTSGSSEHGAEPPDIELQLEMAANLKAFDDCGSLLDYLREATVQTSSYAYGVPWVVMQSGGVIQESAGVERRAASAAGADAVGGPTRDIATNSEIPVPVPEPGVPVPNPELPPVGILEGQLPETPGGGPDGAAVASRYERGAVVAGEEPPEFSGTNVQETGVDEPDVVKTDGRRIVTLVNGELHVLDASGGSVELFGSLELPEGAEELFLHGDRAIVLSRSWDEVVDDDGRDASPHDDSVGVVVGPGGVPLTVITAVDLSDPAEPEIVESRRFEGEYVSARLHAGVVRLVLRSAPELGAIPVPEPAPPEDLGPLGLREESAREHRRRVETALEEAVDDMPLDVWLPEIVTDAGGREPLVPCDAVGHPPEPSGTGMVTVLTVDADGSMAPIDTDAVVADAQTVYASTTTLYLGTAEVVRPDDDGTLPITTTTALHAFDISDSAQTEYVASGRARGRLLNQWSLSEHNGALRVATTDGAPWAGPGGGGPGSESFLTVLRPNGARLEAVGQVGGLGPGERIYAARFFGDLGFVVTFRETDPLYALDLSDPEHPKVAGELKIPGFSTYLHPVGGGLLLGVGQDADERGRTRGTQLSLFDVSDPGHLERIDAEVVPNGHSAVEHDHRAFLWWAPEDLAVIPLQVGGALDLPTGDVGTDSPAHEPFVGAAGFRIEGRAIDPAGRITHADKLPADDVAVSDVRTEGDVEVIELSPPYPPTAPIFRSLVIGDVLYTLSDQGVLASTLDGFDQRGWAAF